MSDEPATGEDGAPPGAGEVRETDLLRDDGGIARLIARATRFQSSGALDQAMMLWKAVILERPDHLIALNNLGILLRHLGRIAESEAVLRTAVERHSGESAPWISLGQTLAAWGNSDETLRQAEEAFARALMIDARAHLAHYGLGMLHLQRGDVMQATADFTAACDAFADHVPSIIGLGRCRQRRGEMKMAKALFSKAIKLAPRNAEAHVRLGMAEFSLGEFPDAWGHYEWRWKLDPLLDRKSVDLPLWKGTDLAGRALLVKPDGGYATIFQFIRFLKKIRGGPVIFDCPPELQELLRGSRWMGEMLPSGENAPDPELWVPLSSIPYLIGAGQDDIKSYRPYLRPDPTRLAPWRARLGGDRSIGIVWHGDEAPYEDRLRSIPIEAFSPLVTVPGVTLVSLQKGEGRKDAKKAPMHVTDLSALIDEEDGAFTDTAAILNLVDTLVSVDGAVAHLAGALGRPVHVILPKGAEWRFSPEGGKTPWYPSMTLHTYDPLSGPQSAVAEVAMQLARR